MTVTKILVIDDQIGRKGHEERACLETIASVIVDLGEDDAVPSDEVICSKVESRKGEDADRFAFVCCSGQSIDREGKRAENDKDLIMKTVGSAWPPTQDTDTAPWALVLLDVHFVSGLLRGDGDEGKPEGEAGDQYFGETVAKQLQEKWPNLPLVMLTAMKQKDLTNGSAVPYFNKSNLEDRRRLVTLLVERGHLDNDRKCELLKVPPEFVVRSESLINTFIDAFKTAQGHSNVLIQGETGVGKDVLAKYIHSSSPRCNKKYVPYQISKANGSELVITELFGHEAGAFTDAKEAKEGLFEQAQGGTLFLDEIGEFDEEHQHLLLRAIEQKAIVRMGGDSSEPIELDVRLIFATNRTLSDEVSKKEFREDLYQRINQSTIKIAPLRERRDDILPLVDYFLKTISSKQCKKGLGLSKASRDKILGYDFPGNVRELENVVGRLVEQHNDHEEIDCESVERACEQPGASEIGQQHSLEDIETLLEAVAVNAEDEAALNSIVPKVTESVRLLYRRIIGAGLKRHNNEKKAAVVMLWGEEDVSQPDDKLGLLLGGGRGEFSREVLKKMVDEYENGQH